jgi:hypothetical protein
MKPTTLVLTLLLAVPCLSAAQSLPPAWERLKLADSVLDLKFGGDLRLRDDMSAKRGSGQNNRGRLRYRLRAGIELMHPYDLTTVMRFGSGTGEQVSTNQSFDNLSGQKALWIDLVYLRYKPVVHPDATTQLQAGRMVNNLWRVYSSDIVWDDDFNPEGFGESAEWVFADAGVSLFANGLQAVTDEDSSSGKNQWVFSSQLGVEKTLPLDTRLRLAGAYHKWSDENRSSLSQVTVQDGNRRLANGSLASQFRVGEVTGQVSGWLGSLPLAAQATLIRNFGTTHNDVINAANAGGPGPLPARDGYQYGLILGAAKLKGQWEVAYFRKYSQAESTVADVADSDFGDGGTNRTGHIAWFAYDPADWMQVKVKGFVTDALDRSFPTVAGVTPTAATNLDKAINRLQLDLSIKF